MSSAPLHEGVLEGLSRVRRATLLVWLGPLLLFLGFGLLHLFCVAPLKPIDERGHVGYAMAISEGRLPKIDDPLDTKKLGVSRRKRIVNQVWVANHPPLFYTAAAPFIAAPKSIDNAIRAARGLSLGFALLALGLVMASLRELGARQRETLVCAALVAGIPGLVHVCSIVHNDAAAWAATLALLYSSARIFMRGPSRRELLLFALLCGVGMLTRVTLVIPMVCASFVVALGIHRAHMSNPGHSLKLVAYAAGLVTVAVLLIAGWFYLRSYQLYGDPTGAAYLLEAFHRKPKGEVLELLLRPDRHLRLYREAWGRFAGHRAFGRASVLPTLLLLVALGLAWVQRKRESLAHRRVFVIACAGLWVLLTVAAMRFHSQGGSLHGRYLLVGMWLLAWAIAFGFRWSATLSCLAVVTLTVNHLIYFATYLSRFVGKAALKKASVNVFELAARANELEWAGLWVNIALLCIVVGVSFCCRDILAEDQ